jgi:hypothetical protein
MERDPVSWDSLEALVADLAEQVRGEPDHHAVVTDRWVVDPFKGER